MTTTWVIAACVLGGCWHEDALIDDTFTAEEWEFLSTQFVLPEPELCVGLDNARCEAAADFGHRLFFEPALSGRINIDDPFAPAEQGTVGAVSCASCHDSKRVAGSSKRFFFTDTRSQPSNVSSGANRTKHNAMSVVNTAYKSAVANTQCGIDPEPTCLLVYSWTGVYATAAGVLAIAGPKAMNSSPQIMAQAICENAEHLATYVDIFGGTPLACPGRGELHHPDRVFDNVAIALDAYTRRLTSKDSRFDLYTRGETELSDRERRGLALFIGKAMCIDCHRGPLLSDLKFHNTGVPQIGANVPALDLGLGESQGSLHDGEFLTPPLRHVAETAPYMHAGQLATLAEVIEFYRRGGSPEGFAGRKDPRMQPLEIDDEEARDLEAFLRTLTGNPVEDRYAEPPS